ncbi:hypothetical protein LNV23_19570 [Paucibacter sp. DJ1R-11]|jgi:hypothetical protein|uniref:hypothetical protein n=1 Tax=unclassified Roseateles TaxID=2626991 RepID=UPI0021E36622|nr:MULTISPECIES: hypothetical protein [unclassified Roseateles]MCV2365655.1 hypothetical protein [Paucibacter sp. DJ1R-11]MCV2420745.1 hypothetical protein [Paucibacter sp. DJ4R-1]MCV2439944.1 hypothetical protein [Paucibacter sp. DJ2R-2]
MWKLLVGFFLFAALAIFIMSKGGDIDMSGEKHDVTAGHAEAPAAASEPAAAVAASAPASAASN